MSKLPENNRRLVRNAALSRYLNVSDMCVWRWKRDPKLGCPPSYPIHEIEWNDLDEWDAWLQARAVSHLDRAAKQRHPRSERLAKGHKQATAEVA